MAGWTKTSGVNGTASQATLALGSVAAGQLIRVVAAIGTASDTVTCSDDQDGAYTLAKQQINTGDGSKVVEFFLYPTVNTGSRTVTIAGLTATCRIIASWFTPPTGTTAVPTPTQTNSASANLATVDSGNVTAALGDLVAGAASNSNNTGGADWTTGGTSAGGSWATDQDFNDGGGGTHMAYSQFVVATSAGTFSSAPTYAVQENIASQVVVYAATVGVAAKAGSGIIGP